jgi:predicted restriction endonuclease
MPDFITYLKTLKSDDWNKMATSQWTVKDVVAHMVGWERRDAEVIPIFWKTKKREPWMSTRAEWDEFNRKEVERYTNYAPQQLLDEWQMWQKKVKEEIDKIGYDNIKSRSDLFDWILEDEGHYTLNEGGSHYEHHYEQIKNAVQKDNGSR